MTPDLPTCPREDCTSSDRHYHRLGGTVCQCRMDLDYCQRNHAEDEPAVSRCYAPRTHQPQPAAVVLPTVEEVTDIIKAGGFYSDTARAVLDLIAARLPVWHPVEPGTVIKAGTRYHRVNVAKYDFEAGTDVFIDPRTVPAEPEDPALAVVREWLKVCGPIDAGTDDARDLLARIDAVRSDHG